MNATPPSFFLSGMYPFLLVNDKDPVNQHLGKRSSEIKSYGEGGEMKYERINTRKQEIGVTCLKGCEINARSRGCA